MGKDYRYGNYHYGYAQAPTAPSMEITINQGGADSSKNTYQAPSPAGQFRPPLSPNHPPPPPPSYGGYEHPAYNPLWFDRFPRRENRGMFRLCLVELLLAAVILGGGIWCLLETAEYCPYYSAIWTSVIFIVNALVGIVAAKVGTINLYTTHLVLSLVSVMICLVSGGLSARNWALVGTYHHPRIERDEAFCLLGEHDATRLRYIFSHLYQYDFSKCLYQLKVGVAVNSVQFVVAGIEIFLNLISAALCVKRTCSCS
ncbi:unnamed protein product [Cylicocyclus nassatus]|uniref:Uncharacterized protein n=1 Tax=Cylicocyclus nassatus TaxID=53992 RepID=A0AA36GRS4_CYLNA|nr:unnamed protein product [Cylicocyclus nassatus]